MTKLKTGSAPYRDDPEDVDAVSMHTTRDDYEYDDAPELPSYSDSEAAAEASGPANHSTPSSTREILNFDPYPKVQALSNEVAFSGSKVQNVNETTIRIDARLADPEELEKYIKNYLAVVPPDQRVRILGSHTEKQYNQSSKKNEQKKVIDFDISLSLSSYLTRERGLWCAYPAHNSDSVYRGSFRKTKAKGYRQDVEIGEGEITSLQDWCREYCNNKSALKAFRVDRYVAGLDIDFLLQSLERITRSTHYHGQLDISFPIVEKNVDIYSDHWINKWRFGWQRWFFYLTFLWLITWPVLFFFTKFWSVYSVRWQWSGCHTDAETERTSRFCASLTEKEWIQKHKNLIMNLVLKKYQGDATQFPTDVPDERVNRGIQARLPSTGNHNVDAAVSFIQGGINAFNSLQGRGGGDLNGWGANS